ncbi:TPT-domain-containing protein [Aspergillus steynii IBT 23096]|uniref:TPT-domain-containing protein n=1 Tax=Aspergillus steynii IBT 23096 TaxID=1392250 RepID=A0A2I2GI11_9EURO|nr:TPT-domain-containing protein [Aspergillus steynii IBT 23096]PLB52518.1 TPT-domain-containing protein [Aspergillus steynii IBT 23096]
MTADTLPKWLALPASRRRCSYLFAIFVILVVVYEFRTLLLPPVVYPLYESDESPKLARSLSARDLLSRPISHDLKTLPKLIHQTWFPAGSNMSERAQVWVETMRAQNPDWEYVLWDDETDRMIVEQHFPWFLETYDKLPQEILRADVARNFYMYLIGGMYADVDTEALRPVEPLFLSHDTPLLAHRSSLSQAPPSPLPNHPQTQRAFLGRMSRSPDLNSNAAVPNGWMASSPGHPFWLLPALHVLERAESGGDGSVEDLTGPGALQRMGNDGWSVVLGMLSWVFWSNLTILFNKWVISSTEFPVILTTWHLVFATLVTQIMAYTTTLLDARKTVEMTPRVYMRAIVPIGLLYSGSLVCSNVVYLYLNVSFVQMIKAAGPVITLLTSWLWGVATPSLSVLLNILVIAASVGLAVAGEIQFSLLGLLFQLASLVFDANRLVMIQILLSDEGQRMDPLVSLYYSAPVCAVMNFLVAWRTEWPGFQLAEISRNTCAALVLNAAVGFMLNVSIFVLIGKTSGLTMTLVSIPKNILLIFASVVIWHTQIGGLQVFGYTIALLALVYYSLGWEKLKGLWEDGRGWVRGSKGYDAVEQDRV